MPKFVHKRAHIFSLLRGPVHIGRVEFHALISHLGDGANGTGEIFLKIVANRVEFQADRDLFECGAADVASGAAAASARKVRREMSGAIMLGMIAAAADYW